MKKPRHDTTKKGKQPIQTPAKRNQGVPGFPIYNITLKGELPIDISARVSAIHARSILQSDSIGSSDSNHGVDPDEVITNDPGVV